jgi:zinc transport system substrate-binding protein
MKILTVLLLVLLNVFANKLEVTTSILPQKYFIEKIGGDKVIVNAMVQPGFSPHTYEPKISQMRQLSSSKAYFFIGVSFEQVWLEKFKAANKNLTFVDTTKGIEKIAMLEHSHEEEEEHDHHDKHKDEKHDEHDDYEGLDPHVWLDPILVKTMAKNIYVTLVELDSANKEYYQTNYENFIQELDALYLELKNSLAQVKGSAFMVFHPSWGYFAQRFGLEQIAVEVAGKEPKPNQMIELIEKAKEHKIKTLFVAPEFSQKSAKVIASSIQGKVVAISPLDEKWSETLRNAAKMIVESHQK